MIKSYYVDTCIYLNLWQREVVSGLKLWRLAKDFFDKIEKRGEIIYYSGFILKEMKYLLSEEEFNKKREMFALSPKFAKEVLTKEEYEEARKIEGEIKEFISFYDLIHILLAKKTSSVLITRDKKMIQISERLGVEANRPEETL